MFALIDCGIGNLRSVQKALETVGANVQLTTAPEVILAAEKVILPGVGAFGDGMAGMRARDLIEPVKTVVARGTPFLGICVGMQLLFESSSEMGEHPGLGILPGTVRRFEAADIKIPQTGWNQIVPQTESKLLYNVKLGDYTYFNHSYYCAPTLESDVLATTNYGGEYASIVRRGNLYGVQFHPEKSQHIGLQILRNFVERC